MFDSNYYLSSIKTSSHLLESVIIVFNYELLDLLNVNKSIINLNWFKCTPLIYVSIMFPILIQLFTCRIFYLMQCTNRHVTLNLFIVVVVFQLIENVRLPYKSCAAGLTDSVSLHMVLMHSSRHDARPLLSSRRGR